MPSTGCWGSMMKNDDVSKNAFVRGVTSIEGKIERVGGATRLYCGMRVHGYRRLLICRVKGTDVARELGHHLYERAVVTGEAMWYRRNLKIHHFTITGMAQVNKGRASDKFARLRRVVGDDWDALDPTAAVADLRDDS